MTALTVIRARAQFRYCIHGCNFWTCHWASCRKRVAALARLETGT